MSPARARIAVSLRVADPQWRSRLQKVSALCRRAAEAAFEEAQETHSVQEISLLLTNDEEMARLNGEWRGMHRPTNVLSFPASDKADDAGFGGDIALGFGVVEREARQGALAIGDHTAHLVVHGVLHLLGYCHGKDEDARQMESCEVRALARIGVENPYCGSVRKGTGW